MINRENYWNVFDSSKHLAPEFSRKRFDSIHLWDFGWEILELINIAPDDEAEIELAKRLSPGQKALYFWWYLDAQVTNGGFIQFYINEYDKYLPAIIEGLTTIEDGKMLELLNKVDSEYEQAKNTFDNCVTEQDFEQIYKNLPEFNKLDEEYYEIHIATMSKMESYLRANKSQFLILKE